MSYTVLARKWRPKNFSELVGQNHVHQALSNALDQQRLHHAYLFTGTRGVGKTTIARIFAKALNCEEGISSTPCGQCAVCQSIDEGRFVDLIEVDAASRTKVEDTREILDNVQYAPVQGRYKVYLIDEVHMLSKSSFNALLKTLEEPPEHVKFLLATTDPHKLPITVLSRCLQFNLMRLTQVQIQQHLAFILQQESVEFDPSALALLSKSADGSARDALSLLDQAIAYGGGQVMYDAIQNMLGLVDQQFTVEILQALNARSAENLHGVIVKLASMGVDYVALLGQLVEVFHQVSMLQVLGSLTEVAVIDEAQLATFSEELPIEKVQVYYQIALMARQDMTLVPDVRIGFEMSLLRMLAFEPMDHVSVSATNSPSSKHVQQFSSTEVRESSPAAQSAQLDAIRNQLKASPTEAPEVKQVSEPSEVVPEAPTPDHLQGLTARIDSILGKSQSSASRSVPAEPEPAVQAVPVEPFESFTSLAPASAPAPVILTEPLSEPLSEPVPESPQDDPPVVERMAEEKLEYIEAAHAPSNVFETIPLPELQSEFDIESWLAMIERLEVTGIASELVNHSVLLRYSESEFVLGLDPLHGNVRIELAEQRLQERVWQVLGQSCFLKFETVEGDLQTPSKYWQQQTETKQSDAVASIHQDEIVQNLVRSLDMKIISKSIKPIG